MIYYKLTDLGNKGTVVRAEGRSQQKFIKDKGWIESGVMIKYFNTDSPYYGSYNEITEEEASNLIAII